MERDNKIGFHKIRFNFHVREKCWIRGNERLKAG